MNKSPVVYAGLALLAALALFGVPSAAVAHIDVSLKAASGPAGGTTPYSTKMTCGGCHFNCATGAYDDNRATWCQDQAAQKDCSVPGSCPDYASYETNDTAHSQGYADSSGLITFATATTKSPLHGASVGFHSQHGRNEEMTPAQRTIWGAPAFVSSPGMFGRYCMPSNRQLVRQDFDAANLDPAGRPREMEMGVSNWAKSCGVCHAGGGQMEYDRSMNEYGATSPTGDRYTWLIPTASGSGAPVNGALVDVSTLEGNAKDRQLTGANKAEVDCLLCHMSEMRPAAAYYKNTLGCSDSNMTGPADNPNCGAQKAVFMDMKTGTPMMMADSRFDFSIGGLYDSYNRNIAISYGYFGAAASAGIGAGIDLATGAVTNVPTLLAGSKIGKPTSGSCAQCHARNEADNIGLPGEAQVFGGMIAGYGNFVRLTPSGDAFDWDKIAADGSCASDCTNSSTWTEFGCKTGMGKRSQKTGNGSSDRWGNGFCMICDSQDQWATNSFCGLPSVQNACIAETEIPTLISDNDPMSLIDITAQGPRPKLIPGKMPDLDVHEAGDKGITCSSCHYTMSGTIPARTISAGSNVYTYPSATFVKMDHNMSKGYSMLEKGGDGFEGTVSCASCHIAGENHHPNAAALAAPIAGHAGFPALHFDKIDCRTCHIPAIYASPGRLMFRDWTAGAYRQTEGSNGNANHFEFAMSMLEGGMTPIRTLPMWISTPEGTKITPMQTNFLPIWAGSVTNLSDSKVSWSPAKTRDVNAAVAVVSAANPAFGIRINGTNEHPGFQGFQLTDPLKIESKAKIDAVAAELASARTGVVAEHSVVRDARINLYPLFYDTSHGVVPNEYALGSPSRGGCVMCHSTSAKNPMTGQPVDPTTYSDKSVGFFDGTKEMLQNGFMIMASYDCDNPYIFTLMTTGQTTTLASPTCLETTPPEMGGTGLCDGTAKGTTSLGAQNGTMGLCKETIGGKLAQSMGMPADPMMRMDGVEFMQMMAVREGASLHSCNPMMQIFGLPTNCNPEDYYSRSEISLYFAKSMQQSFFTPSVAGAAWNDPTGATTTVPSTLGRVFGVSTQIKKNPGNANHQNVFDFGATCRNPLDGSRFPCSTAMPGMTNLIDTAVSSNQILGYDAVQYAKLTSPATAGLQVPTAIVSYAKSGLTVNLDASGSVCPSGSCGYSWNFGDNASGTGVTAAHAYGAAGTYTVTLTVSDAVSATNGAASVTFDVAAANSAPAAGFTSNLVDYGSPSYKTSHNWVVVLNDTSTDESTATLAISVNWGDGSIEPLQTGAGSSFSHTYVNAGFYTISYRVTDNGGMSATITQPVKIVKYQAGGKVTRSNGTTAVSSVKMDLKQGAAVVKTVYTNYLGNYAFTNLKPGTYTIVPSKTGLVFDVVPDVTVGADITTANISSTN